MTSGSGFLADWGSGRASTAVQDCVWTDTRNPRNNTQRGAIYCHPNVTTIGTIEANTGGLYTGQRALRRAFATNGYTVAASDLGFFDGDSGNGSMGNAAEQARITELDTWAKTGAGGSTEPRVHVASSAGMVGDANLYGTTGDLDDVAAFVWILPVFDMRRLYLADTAGIRNEIEFSLGITYAGSDNMPANSSPKDTATELYGKHFYIAYPTLDPLINAQDIEDMQDAYGPNVTVRPLEGFDHDDTGIGAVDLTDLMAWLHNVAPVTT